MTDTPWSKLALNIINRFPSDQMLTEIPSKRRLAAVTTRGYGRD